MSILIKGMEMPKDDHLFVKIDPDGTVSTTAKNGYKKYEAVPIPPHGRLIDADAADDYAYDELEVSYSYLSPREASRNMQLLYRNMPTIIPAEPAAEDKP